MNKSALIIAILFLTNIGFSWQVKLMRTFSIDEKELFLLSCFAPLENGNLIFSDLKDENHQIKLFNEDGQLIKAWGKMGLGPGEFAGAGFLDFNNPYLAVADAGKHRVHVFEITNHDEFKEIAELPAWELNLHLKIYRRNVLFSGYIFSPEGKGYALFMRDFKGEETKYILPVEYRFGAGSMSEHKKIHDEVSGISNREFFDVCQDTVFFVSDVRPRVVKIDLNSMKAEFIGKEPDDFRALAMNKKTREALMNSPSSKEIVEDIMAKHSFVTGLFADKDFVGILYVNRDKKINKELFYAPHIQLYDHSGKFLHGQSLAPFLAEEKFIPYFYQKDKRRLYLLSSLSDESTVKYVMYEFSVEP